MAKEQPTPLEALVPDTEYFIEEITEFPYRGGWGIFSKTKYGNKIFNSYTSKEAAIGAAKYHGLKLAEEK